MLGVLYTLAQCRTKFYIYIRNVNNAATFSRKYTVALLTKLYHDVSRASPVVKEIFNKSEIVACFVGLIGEQWNYLTT